MTETSLTNSFSKMLFLIDNSIHLLKYFNSLKLILQSNSTSTSSSSNNSNNLNNLNSLTTQRSHPSLIELTSSLQHLERTISMIEHNINQFESFLNSEIELVNRIEQFSQLLIKQTNQINHISKNIPSIFLLKSEINENSKLNNENVLLLVEKSEFENVSKSTRSRLQLQQIIEALNNIHTLVLRKTEKLATHQKTRSSATMTMFEEFRSLKNEEHNNQMFLSEKELRQSVIFEGGESTGRAILQTLRALQRIKLVRSNGESTYVLLVR